MTRRTFTPDELRELAKDRGPFFADTARAALIYCADVKAAADEAIQEASRRLAAAEARNATLTDDAARYRFLRNWTRGVRSVEFGCADFAFPKIRVAAGVNVMRGAVCQHLDTAIDAELARAAASISTNPAGDAHADTR